LLRTLARLGAAALLECCIEREGPDFFREPDILENIELLNANFHAYCHPEAFPAVIDFLHKHCHESLDQSLLLPNLYGFVGDRRLLKVRVLAVCLSDTVPLLYARGHLDLLLEYLQFRLSVEGGCQRLGGSPIPRGLFVFALERNLLAAIHNGSLPAANLEECDRLSWAQWEMLWPQLAQLGSEWIPLLMLIAPTPEIYHRLRRLGEEKQARTAPAPDFLSFRSSPPRSALRKAAAKKNWDCVRHYLQCAMQLAGRAENGDAEAATALLAVWEP
jgi:hypothetical protein